MHRLQSIDRVAAPRRGRRGFTLVELIVVVGIIVLLMGILLPAVNRVREQVKRTGCQAQMKQIGFGLLEFSAANRDYFPGPASVGGGHQPDDWVHWQKTPTLLDVTKSPIAKYVTTDKAKLEAVLVCPTDPNPTVRAYRFSYTMNHKFAKFRRRDTVRPEGKILLVEEGEKTIDDGRWVWPGNALATWHDRAGVQNQAQGFGSVFFVGGSAGYVTRDQSDDPKFCEPKQP